MSSNDQIDLIPISDFIKVTDNSTITDSTLFAAVVQGASRSLDITQIFASPAAGDFETQVNIEMPLGTDPEDPAFTIRTTPTTITEAPFVVRGDGRLSLNNGEFNLTAQNAGAFISIGDGLTQGSGITMNTATGETSEVEFFAAGTKQHSIKHSGDADTLFIGTNDSFGGTFDANGRLTLQPNASAGLVVDRSSGAGFDNVQIKANGALANQYYISFFNNGDTFAGGFQHDGKFQWEGEVQIAGEATFDADVNVAGVLKPDAIFLQQTTSDVTSNGSWLYQASGHLNLRQNGENAIKIVKSGIDVATFNIGLDGINLNYNTFVNDTDESADVNSGALKVLGGAAVAKNLHVGGGLAVNGRSLSTTANDVDALLIADANGDNKGFRFVEITASTPSGPSQSTAGVSMAVMNNSESISGWIGANNSGNLTIEGRGGNNYLTFTTSGSNVGVSGVTMLGDGTAITPALNFIQTGGEESGFYRTGSGATNQINATANRIDVWNWTQDRLKIVATQNATGAGTGSLQTDGGAYIAKDLIVDGNFTVNGTFTVIDTETLETQDPLIKLAKDNPADINDIGFFGQYNDGTTRYSGIARDASNGGRFIAFQGLETEPTTTVDVGGTGFVYSPIDAGGLSILSDSAPDTSATGLYFYKTAANRGVIENRTDLLEFKDDGQTIVTMNQGLYNVQKPAQYNDTISVQGIASFINTTDSTAPNDGAVILSGGMGIAKNLFVGENVDAAAFLASADAETFTADEQSEYTNAQPNIEFVGGEYRNTSTDGQDYALTSQGASAGTAVNWTNTAQLLTGISSGPAILSSANYGDGNNSFVIDLGVSRTFNKLSFYNGISAGVDLASIVKVELSDDNFSSGITVGNLSADFEGNLNAFYDIYSLRLGQQYSYRYIRITVVSATGGSNVQWSEFFVYDAEYASSSNTVDTLSLATGSGTMNTMTASFKEGDLTDISGTGKLNVAYSVDGGAFTSLSDLETFRAIGDISYTTSFDLQVQPVGPQTFLVASIGEPSTDVQVLNSGYIGIDANSVNVFNVNASGNAFFAGDLNVGGADNVVQFTVNGTFGHTANLLEFKDSGGTTLGSFDKDGNLDLISQGSVDFGNWKFSEFGNTLSLTNGVTRRAVIQNGFHATYGWELSWYNDANGNRFGFYAANAGDVELRGTKDITTDPISFSVYNTWTDVNNYERGLFDWKKTSNVLTIGAEALGTGTLRDVKLVGASVTIEPQASFSSYTDWKGIAAPALSTAGEGRIYFDSTSNVFKVSENGGAYADLVSSGSSDRLQAGLADLVIFDSASGSIVAKDNTGDEFFRVDESLSGQIRIGNSNGLGSAATSIGQASAANGARATVVGYNNFGNGIEATVIGNNNTNNQQRSFVGGHGNTCSSSDSVIVGIDCLVSGSNAAAIGAGAAAAANEFVTSMPTWKYLAGTSDLTIANPLVLSKAFSQKYDTSAVNVLLDATHGTMDVDATSGSITVTLPAASTCAGRIYNIRKSDNSVNTVIVDPNASETINGDATSILSAQYTVITIQSTGSNWIIL